MKDETKTAEEINRYDIYIENGDMEKDIHPKGNWVRFQDHEKLLSQQQSANAELKKQNAELVEALKLIYSNYKNITEFYKLTSSATKEVKNTIELVLSKHTS